jgi:hypothetical protein
MPDINARPRVPLARRVWWWIQDNGLYGAAIAATLVCVAIVIAGMRRPEFQAWAAQSAASLTKGELLGLVAFGAWLIRQ